MTVTEPGTNDMLTIQVYCVIANVFAGKKHQTDSNYEQTL